MELETELRKKIFKKEDECSMTGRGKRGVLVKKGGFSLYRARTVGEEL